MDWGCGALNIDIFEEVQTQSTQCKNLKINDFLFFDLAESLLFQSIKQRFRLKMATIGEDNVNTEKFKIQIRFSRAWLQLAILAPLALMMVGCMKKCQIPKERQTSVAATEWRLVETTDPDPDIQNNLSNFTFLIFRFGQDFQGDIKAVVNNTQFDTPFRTFQYEIDPQSKTLEIVYSNPTGENSGAEGQNSQQPSNEASVFYYYSLGRQLELTSSQGYYYRLVPFTGILSPDDTCTF